ncbi:MAG: hypothetical protein Q4C95_07590 [Planctomycetia bacterium]|nr:hypothetical protein [Planctomycetia bacterium]
MNIWGLFCSFIILPGLWTPVSLEQFYLTSNQANILIFETDQSKPLLPDFNLYDSEGTLLFSEKGDLTERKLSLTLKLSQGFYELEFPETNQRFGLLSQPYYCGETSTPNSQSQSFRNIHSLDSFFAIDGALSWLVSEDEIREQLIKIARKVGIITLRERLSWNHIEPEQGKFDFDAAKQYQQLRFVCANYEMPVLELFHDAPSWMKKVEKYPHNLVQTFDSWKSIQKQWKHCWNSFEAWNEPDIQFGGNLPADQYVSVLKTISYLFQQQNEQSPILGGSIAMFQDQWMKTAAQSELLDYCDIFSFHTYCQSPQMEGICLKFQNWLTENNSSGKPVWITECGRPWKKGTDRPNSVEDKASAIDIVMKGVEAKACGFDSYFPFVYPFYEENDNNFGMTDKNYAPLRSFAAYVQMIRVLSHWKYIGDPELFNDPESLSHSKSTFDRMRVFSNEAGERLIVCYSAIPQKGARITLPFLPKRVERITGEVEKLLKNEKTLTKAENSIDSKESTNGNGHYQIDFSDGFLYIWVPDDFELSLNDNSVVGQIQKERSEARQSEIRENNFEKRKALPIVLRYEFDSNQVEANRNGYKILPTTNASISLEIMAWNLSYDSKTIPVSCSANLQDVILDCPESIQISPRSSSSFKIRLDIQSISSFKPLKLLISAQDRILLHFTKEITETEFTKLAKLEKLQKPLEIEKTDHWLRNQPSCCQLTFLSKDEMDQESKWGVKGDFTEGDRWFYPFYQLPEDVDLSQYDGFALRIKGKADKTGEVRLFCYEEGERPGTWFTPQSIIPCDDNWHYAIIPFQDFIAFGTDSNNRLDQEKVRRISVGGNTKSEQFSIEVNELFLFKL